MQCTRLQYRYIQTSKVQHYGNDLAANKRRDNQFCIRTTAEFRNLSYMYLASARHLNKYVQKSENVSECIIVFQSRRGLRLLKFMRYIQLAKNCSKLLSLIECQSINQFIVQTKLNKVATFSEMTFQIRSKVDILNFLGFRYCDIIEIEQFLSNQNRVYLVFLKHTSVSGPLKVPWSWLSKTYYYYFQQNFRRHLRLIILSEKS